MGGSSRNSHKPRELRRRVVISARLRHASKWSDASILNISSRGLLIHTTRPLSEDSWVELRRGDHVINARVVWREGSKAGLQAEDRLPVESLASDQIVGEPFSAPPETRRAPPPDRSRSAGRTIEFAGVLGVGAILAVATVTMVEEALARPLALVASVLG